MTDKDKGSNYFGQQVQDVFDILDLDNDGFISDEEMKENYTKLEAGISKEVADNIMNQASIKKGLSFIDL